MTANDKNQTLVVSQTADLKKELFPSKDIGLTVQNGTEIEKKAADYVDQLLSFRSGDVTEQTGRKNAVEQMGPKVLKKAAKQSELLRQPIMAFITSSFGVGAIPFAPCSGTASV